MWQGTCVRGYVTGDTWKVTCGVNILSKFQLSSSLTVWELWCFEDLEEKDELLDQLINDKAGSVYKPA